MEVTSAVDKKKNGYFPKPCVVLCVVNMEKVLTGTTDKIRAPTFHIHFESKVLLKYKKKIFGCNSSPVSRRMGDTA